MKLRRYRIIKDNYAGYECQVWRLWWPFWIQIGFTNTHISIDNAREYIKNIKMSNKGNIVEEYTEPLSASEIRDRKLSKLGIK